MGFNSGFKGLTLNGLKITVFWSVIVVWNKFTYDSMEIPDPSSGQIVIISKAGAPECRTKFRVNFSAA